MGEVTGIAGEGREEREREKTEGGERAREGRGKWGRHMFQAPHKEGGKGKRARERAKDEEQVAEEGKREVGRLGD